MSDSIKENVKPEQQVMGQERLDRMFGDKKGLLVKQTMKGCLQECCGCEAASEYKIAELDPSHLKEYKVSSEGMKKPDIMHASEKSSCCLRLCWRDGRPFNIKVTEGGGKGGTPLLDYRKPCSCPLYCSIPCPSKDCDTSCDCPCCCCLPTLYTRMPSGTSLGSDSAYLCDLYCCVPKLRYSEDGKAVYILRPETCCCGCCVACNCCTCKGVAYQPFFFHDASTGKRIGSEGGGVEPQIRKIWAGFKKECCSTADHFAVIFPAGSDVKRKAGLLGLTFLLDFTLFERQHEGDE